MFDAYLSFLFNSEEKWLYGMNVFDQTNWQYCY